MYNITRMYGMMKEIGDSQITKCDYNISLRKISNATFIASQYSSKQIK